MFYRTGDLVVLNEKEELLFLGRKDRQVKVRGFRIELDDVEAAIILHEAVEEAAVFASKGADDINVIHVAIKVKKDLTEKNLLAFLKTKIPAYALPHTITFLDDLPRTPNGKINRVALKQLLIE